jgi:transposase
MTADEPIRRAEELEREVASLQRRLDRSLGENQRLEQEIARLQKLVEEAVRKRKRNTAPFSRDHPKPDPKTAGRKSGDQYGQQATRPTPLQVDERIAVPLPPCCPHCASQVIREITKAQYQEDIVRVTMVRRFDVEVGVCAGCGRRVQGRHALQTSDAVHVGQVQIGPEALSLAALWNKEMGLSHERVARSLQLGYGLTVSRSGICRAVERLGNLAAPTYEQLTASLRHSPMNGLDDTGWRVGGHLQNLRVIGNESVTVYLIEPHRGFAEAAAVLGADYDGFLLHDGARTWYGFLQAFHQTCLAHPIRRCQDLLKILTGKARQFPQAVLDLLLDSLDLRDRHQQGLVSEHGLAVATGRLEARLDRLLATRLYHAANRRLARHLQHEQPHLFTFLYCPGIPATNNFIEAAIRPMVVARKTWGGNRTWNGARTQQILVSVLRTCWQQGKDVFHQLVTLLRSPQPMRLDLVPVPLSP